MNRVLHTRPVISRVLAEIGNKPHLRLGVHRTGEVISRISDLVVSRVLAHGVSTKTHRHSTEMLDTTQ